MNYLYLFRVPPKFAKKDPQPRGFVPQRGALLLWDTVEVMMMIFFHYMQPNTAPHLLLVIHNY